jgi:CRP-like cAMP-binding protein
MIDLDTAFADLPIQHFEDNEVIIAEGEKSGGLYFLKSGKAAAYRGEDLVAEMDEIGSVYGDVSVLLDCAALVATRAVGATSFYVVKDVDAFFVERPELLLHVARDLAKKLHFMASYLTDVKQQYAGESNHLGMVHEVLDSFLNKKRS